MLPDKAVKDVRVFTYRQMGEQGDGLVIARQVVKRRHRRLEFISDSVDLEQNATSQFGEAKAMRFADDSVDVARPCAKLPSRPEFLVETQTSLTSPGRLAIPPGSASPDPPKRRFDRVPLNKDLNRGRPQTSGRPAKQGKEFCQVAELREK